MTNGDMPAVVIDATGSINTINNAFQCLSHGARYVLKGWQKGEISFSHPGSTLNHKNNLCYSPG